MKTYQEAIAALHSRGMYVGDWTEDGVSGCIKWITEECERVSPSKGQIAIWLDAAMDRETGVRRRWNGDMTIALEMLEVPFVYRKKRKSSTLDLSGTDRRAFPNYGLRTKTRGSEPAPKPKKGRKYLILKDLAALFGCPMLDIRNALQKRGLLSKQTGYAGKFWPAPGSSGWCHSQGSGGSTTWHVEKTRKLLEEEGILKR